MKYIPYGQHSIDAGDIKAVVNVLNSDFITQGPVVPQFEDAIANYSGAKGCVVVNSATSALHIAYLSLGLGPGDYLWTSPNTFVATANSALHCGAKIDFVDIDHESYNMSIESLKLKLEFAEKNGSLPKIVVPVHFAGQPCDMKAIWQLSQRYNFRIVEDASHAIGATYLDAKVGSCAYSDVTVFSFHPVKIITTGEGGAATSNDQTLLDRMRRLSGHGLIRDHNFMESRPDDEIWNYQQIELGFNYRMTDLQAALGLSQLKRLDSFVDKRRELARVYDNCLADLPVVVPVQDPKSVSSYHLYPLQVLQSGCQLSQKHLFARLHDLGIGVNLHYVPVHRQPYFEKLGFKLGDFPNAEAFYRAAMSLPMFSHLQPADQTRVVDALHHLIL